METQPRIKQLKEEADKLGIDYSPNIGPDTLDKRIKVHLAQSTELDANQIRTQKIKDATKLVRVIVTCMDQSKVEHEKQQGEYVMAGNSVVPTIKRMVPYGVPTHVERILLNKMKETKHQQRYGTGLQQYREVPTFAIQELPDLTPEEVEELKKMQAIRAEAGNL